jgi:adenine phosphoribosyltransferase
MRRTNIMKTIEDYIITIPDFPEPGVMFRDVTGVLDSPEGLKLAIDELYKLLDGVEYDVIAGAEARGFLFGMPLAYKAGKRFVPVRKKGKLPRETVEKTYDLEYGTATIEIHKDSIKPGERVVLVDDLIATGGTIRAAADLFTELGGEVVKMLFLIELEGLNGRAKLEGYDVASVVKYPGK